MHKENVYGCINNRYNIPLGGYWWAQGILVSSRDIGELKEKNIWRYKGKQTFTFNLYILPICFQFYKIIWNSDVLFSVSNHSILYYQPCMSTCSIAVLKSSSVTRANLLQRFYWYSIGRGTGKIRDFFFVAEMIASVIRINKSVDTFLAKCLPPIDQADVDFFWCWYVVIKVDVFVKRTCRRKAISTSQKYCT